MFMKGFLQIMNENLKIMRKIRDRKNVEMYIYIKCSRCIKSLFSKYGDDGIYSKHQSKIKDSFTFVGNLIAKTQHK